MRIRNVLLTKLLNWWIWKIFWKMMQGHIFTVLIAKRELKSRTEVSKIGRQGKMYSSLLKLKEGERKEMMIPYRA